MARLDQCLFGYDDGHRLLASSMSLDDQTSSLTELSDLAPGTVFGKSDGYWTAIPLPKLQRYALMRTWPAPEMPRPGCVWTHAVLIDPRLLEHQKDLAELRRVFTRPLNPQDRERYRHPLAFGTDRRGETLPFDPVSDQLVEVSRALLATLYGIPGRPLAVESPGEADEAVFAVWSQQWPRLRRNFRFQTATTREATSSPNTRFDLTIELSGSRKDALLDVSDDQTWLSAAAADIGKGSSGDLRQFLWTYGKDVRRQRGSFRPLVEIKLLNDDNERAVGDRLIGLVDRHFSEVSDGITLKQDIVDGLVVPNAQLDVLRHILFGGGDAAFPHPSEAGVAKLTRLWPDKAVELLGIAESTAEMEKGLGRSVFEMVTRSVPTSEFWTLTKPFARLREKMISARPELLLLDGASELPAAELARYVELVPKDAPVSVELVARILGRNDARLAEEVLDRFEQAGAAQVIATATTDGTSVGRAWIRALIRRPHLLLRSEVIGLATRTSLLFELAEELGWLTPEVAAGGAEPWIASLAKAHYDLSDERLDILRAFFIALGLTVGGNSGRVLLEKFFESVHRQILSSHLPWRARDILWPVVPDLGWLRGWDFGLRLRLAVAECYVRNSFSPASFSDLSSDKKVREMLGDAASEITGGRSYARAIGH